MKKASKIVALLFVAALCLGMFAGCSGSEKTEKALVVGYSPFNSKFSPFFAETAYDQDVQAMTQIALLKNDRVGTIIEKGINGTTIAYNGTDYTYYGPADLTITENTDGTVKYDFKLREDLVFSDGEKLTADDAIFTMYVLSDPSYDGSTTFFALPIKGMEAYRAGMETRGALILKAGPDGYQANDYYTEAQYNEFWDYYNNKACEDFAKEICDYCIANGYNAPTDSVAACAANWGYDLAENATYKDFWDAIVAAYDTVEEAEEKETAGHDRFGLTIAALQGEYLNALQTGESAANIEGIVKTGDYSFSVTTTKIDATAIYQLGIYLTPMHYYGDKAKYDYANNKFGFDKGNLSSVRAKTTQPMGAGAYKFIKFENGVVNFEANDKYYLGAPKTKYVNFKECMTDDDKLNGVTTGTIDVTDPSFSTKTVAAVSKANGAAENETKTTGDKITTSTVDNLGYGYIGMCAKVMNVGGVPDSAASKNLRKAFATVLAVYRELAIDSYYGERASVINYPISNTSWAAPRPTDDGYKVAFSVDATGKDIYTSGMTAEQKYEAALQAALTFFEAAGYTVTDGKVTAAPAGAEMEYTAWIPADGSGDHPSFMILTEASKALEKIGIKLNVKDLTNSSELWTALKAQTVAMWCAAWGATIDPDMYQIYFSGDENAAAGGSNYMYAIDDKDLNKMILDARASTNQAYRKGIYKAALETVVDWAVEIPVYQRQNAIIFSTERVNLNTVTPDITTFYGWMSEIEKTELK
ncbi:MAG: ABC transporter substrate-binding protein [Clostridia bacterium]|nr:ABC transporter substrate-binding protein [Clostridia bacterium]